MSDRKKDHIDLAFRSKTGMESIDHRFNYEPLISAHPDFTSEPFDFLGKRMEVPLWISSMTGGTDAARHINRNLARACHEFGMGMGLGSCRPLLESDRFFDDFDLRELIGEEAPFFANLGVAQIEKSIKNGSIGRILEMVGRLRADGLIIHVNPLQEWLQPEGDRFSRPPIDTIRVFLSQVDIPVIVKEVGQGMGPESLKLLLELPLAAIDFGAFGGTNFAQLELLRSPETKKGFYGPVARLGHDAEEMIHLVNGWVESGIHCRCGHIIVSGGIKDFLDGYYLISQSKLPAIYGQASTFLKYAQGPYEQLGEFVTSQIMGLKLAKAYLKLKQPSRNEK
jgi:isopentenyl-diphosphate delta-isomerase